MMYFIESVRTLNTTGKTRKGAALQAAAQRFEHTIICDFEGLTALISELRKLVAACNEIYRGKEVFLSADIESGQIEAHNERTGSEAYIFMIGFAPVGEFLHSSHIRNAICGTLQDADRDLLCVYRKNTCQEGGEA